MLSAVIGAFAVGVVAVDDVIAVEDGGVVAAAAWLPPGVVLLRAIARGDLLVGIEVLIDGMSECFVDTSLLE
jgi:hypothetical protein